MEGVIAGFRWDEGNRAKCLAHGVSREEIERLFERPVAILPDTAHSVAERRFKAMGTSGTGRHVFIVFTIRLRQGKRYIRPISARYMHAKELRHYEEENPEL